MHLIIAATIAYAASSATQIYGTYVFGHERGAAMVASRYVPVPSTPGGNVPMSVR